MVQAIRFFSFRRGIRHPFFPSLTAEFAARARGRSQALAGSFGELAEAAARGARAARAVYVLVSEGQALSDGEREELWRLFEVPAYALLERGGSVEAWECEAQRGMHAADAGDGIACACGRPGARVAQTIAMAHAAD